MEQEEENRNWESVCQPVCAHRKGRAAPRTTMYTKPEYERRDKRVPKETWTVTILRTNGDHWLKMRAQEEKFPPRREGWLDFPPLSSKNILVFVEPSCILIAAIVEGPCAWILQHSRKGKHDMFTILGMFSRNSGFWSDPKVLASDHCRIIFFGQNQTDFDRSRARSSSSDIQLGGESKLNSPLHKILIYSYKQ